MQTGLLGPYLKIGGATLLGAGLALGIYFLVSQGGPIGQGAAPASSLCVCSGCGFTVPKPKGMDCEEVNCPSCGHSMHRAVVLAAAQGVPGGMQGGAGSVPMTQNRRETLAEQGIATPGPMTQNQRETLAEQGLLVARGAAQQRRAPPPSARLPMRLDNRGDWRGGGGRLDNRGDSVQMRGQAVAATLLPPIGKPGKCVCPACGVKVDRQPGAYCSHSRCPNCGTTMTNAIYVGQRQKAQPQGEARLAAMRGGGAGGGGAGGGPPCQQGGGANPGGAGPLCQQQGAAPGGGQRCPTLVPAPARATATDPIAAASNGLTYSDAVRGIIGKNCLRCHGGPIRNLGTYNHVKAYADNGLLMMMIQPGGPMSRFLSAHEAHQIISWIKNSAPK